MYSSLMNEADEHKLPRGCIHGDPFLDNVLVLADGQFRSFFSFSFFSFFQDSVLAFPCIYVNTCVCVCVSVCAHLLKWSFFFLSLLIFLFLLLFVCMCISAFVDLEDISSGPLLFDVACCAIGSCFDEVFFFLVPFCPCIFCYLVTSLLEEASR